MNNTNDTKTFELREITSERLGDHPNQFLQHLLDQDYTADTIKRYRQCIDSLARAMHEKGVLLPALDEALAVELVQQTGWRARRNAYTVSITRRFVRFLREQGAGRPLPPPTAKEIARASLKCDYETYLRCQRGLSERTIYHCWRHADRFLEFRFGDEAGDLAQIRTADIAAYLQHLTGRNPPYRDKSVCTHLRSFFRYLFKAGKTPANLAQGILSVPQRYDARLPRHVTPEQVDALLAAVRAGRSGSRRNYAMLLLMARLGLRAPEVIAMEVDDIDWRAGELTVRGKGDRYDRVPLPPDVGEAIADYIRHDRVAVSRTLFVTERAPHRPFKDGQILNNILRDAFVATGLRPPAPYVGAHVLRHSLAVSLVRQGASLDEIGDMLRHRARASTARRRRPHAPMHHARARLRRWRGRGRTRLY
jgi:site-specific recombinase XerD